MAYTKISVTTKKENSEPLQAFFGTINEVESLVSTDTGFDAFIKSEDYNNVLSNNISAFQNVFEFDWSETEIENQNWNLEWETNYRPIHVGSFCGVRASFHPPFTDLKYDLVITPEMSFGTGHHETTKGMITLMKDVDFADKTVLDAGCGTGVLAILAAKMGALNVEAIDNDPNCIRSTRNNCIQNDVKKVNVTLSDIRLGNENNFDVVIANINLNVILASLQTFYNRLNPKGELLISGFYEADRLKIENQISSLDLAIKNQFISNEWLCLHLVKA